VNRNIEIKARASDFRAQMRRAAEIADSDPGQLQQEDTFFNCPTGRLKLRELAGRRGELIYYQRRDVGGPKECRYLIATTREPEIMRRILGEVLGVLGVVSKTRTVYLAGQTRIHFDEVERLGHFIELEVVMEPEQDQAQGDRIVRRLMDHLAIEEDDLIDRAYVDLLLECPRTRARASTRDRW
jgi:predicted adenylyl cyclase CyaB